MIQLQLYYELDEELL
jgi:hypothetical protein